MIKIPNPDNKILLQNNRSKIYPLANLWSTWNIDLQDNPGAIRVANKLMLNTSTASDADLGCPVAFKHFDGLMWALCGTRVFKSSASNLVTAFTEDASSNAQTTFSPDTGDMVVAFGDLVATTQTDVYSKASNGSGTGAWFDRANLTTGHIHKLLYFKKLDTLYVTDLSAAIYSFSNDWTYSTSGDYTLDLSTVTGSISCLEASSERIWIGMVNKPITENLNRQVSVFEWDGLSSAVSSEYKVDAEGIMAMLIDNDSPVIIDNNAIIRAFNGSGFEEIGRLPLRRELLTNSNSTTANNRWIHPNGFIKSKNGTYLLNINNLVADNGNTILENMPSGVWEFDPKTGSLTHKHSFSYIPISSPSVTDYGQNRISRIGALTNANIYSTSASGRGTLIAGATIYTNASSTTSGIFVDAPHPTDNSTTTEGQKYGYFVTPWIHSRDIKDNWQSCVVKYRQLLDSGDKIDLKYRLTEAAPTEISITWVDTNTFTTSTNVSGKEDYEVEVIQGTGSGKTAHVSSISENAGTYTVNLDDTFTGVTTGTAKARLQNWVKVPTLINDQESESKVLSIGESSERIQLKCCMQFTGDDELFELNLINKPQEYIN